MYKATYIAIFLEVSETTWKGFKTFLSDKYSMWWMSSLANPSFISAFIISSTCEPVVLQWRH